VFLEINIFKLKSWRGKFPFLAKNRCVVMLVLVAATHIGRCKLQKTRFLNIRQIW